MLRPRPRLAPVMRAIRAVMRRVCAGQAAAGAPDAAGVLPDPVNGSKRRLPPGAARFSMNAVATALDELRDIVRRHCPVERGPTPLARVAMWAGTADKAPLPAIYPTMVCFVLQGCKRVSFGSRTLVYRGESYTPADIRVLAPLAERELLYRLIQARTGRCYVSSPSPAAACRRFVAPSSGFAPTCHAPCAWMRSPPTPA
jgi:hypothetical protein